MMNINSSVNYIENKDIGKKTCIFTYRYLSETPIDIVRDEFKNVHLNNNEPKNSLEKKLRGVLAALVLKQNRLQCLDSIKVKQLLKSQALLPEQNDINNRIYFLIQNIRNLTNFMASEGAYNTFPNIYSSTLMALGTTNSDLVRSNVESKRLILPTLPLTWLEESNFET